VDVGLGADALGEISQFKSHCAAEILQVVDAKHLGEGWQDAPAARPRLSDEELRAKIDDTEKKIRALQEEEQQSGVILTAAQQDEIESFRGEMIRLRQELRAVQRSLREDVESLSTWVKIANIWAVPVLIALIAVVVALLRRSRIARGAARPA